MRMRTFSKTVPVFFLVCMIAVSGIPAFVNASDPSAPAIYYDLSIYVGDQLAVSGVGFSPSATIMFMCGDQWVQTVPNPLVADSSGAFTGLLVTSKLNEGICTLTATDGKTFAQSPLAINPHEHNTDPRQCDGSGHNSVDVAGCGCFSAANFGLFGCCAAAGASKLAPLGSCCTDAYGLDDFCTPV